MAIDDYIARYRLDGDATDETGSFNGTASAVTYTSGKQGQAGSFNGTSSVISNASFATGTQNITLAAWAYCTNGTVESRIIAWGVGSGNRASIQVKGVTSNTARGIFGGETGGTATRVGTEVAFTPNQWTHWVLTFSSTTMVLYKNSVATTNTFAATSIGTGSQICSIGARASTPTSFYPGLIDDVRIYNRVLSAAEVLDLYNSYTGSLLLRRRRDS